MAKQHDKHPQVPPTAPTNTDRSDPKERDGKAEGKDPDTYDPVGMAGKKAGVVERDEDEKPQTEKAESKPGLGTTGWRTGA